MARKPNAALKVVDNESSEPINQRRTTNHLKLRLDDLKTFDPFQKCPS